MVTSVNFESMKIVLANIWHPLGVSLSLILARKDSYSIFIVRWMSLES